MYYLYATSLISLLKRPTQDRPGPCKTKLIVRFSIKAGSLSKAWSNSIDFLQNNVIFLKQRYPAVKIIPKVHLLMRKFCLLIIFEIHKYRKIIILITILADTYMNPDIKNST